MSEKPEATVHVLRGLATRLRSLAMTEPTIAVQLRRIADDADDYADAMASQQRPRAS